MFNRDKVVDQDFPIRRITITPTDNREQPYVLRVGQEFKIDKSQSIKIVRIENRLDMYEKYGDRVYDVYAEKNGFQSRWKRFDNIKGVDIEYDMDF